MPSLKDAGTRSNLYHIDPRKLKPKPGLNPRDFEAEENKQHVRELADSIKEIGVKQPLTITNEDADYFWITDGESRWRACMLAIEEGADIVTVPCKAEEKAANELDKAYQPIILNSGKALTQLEQGKQYKRLLDMGETEANIAKRSGKSAMHINNCLKLYAAPAPIQQLVRAGKVASTLATNVIRSEGPEQAQKTLAEAVETAQATGKGKATQKDVEAVQTPSERVSGYSSNHRLKVIKKNFEEAITSIHSSENDDGTMTLVFAAEDYNEIIEMLGI